jgi:outer membrane immunogenic protein
VNRLAVSVTALLALTAAPVLAADLAVKSPPTATAYSWSGFYAGANAGYRGTDDPGRPRCFQSGVENGPECQNVVPVPTIHGSGFIGGAQAGYNWEFGPNLISGSKPISTARR